LKNERTDVRVGVPLPLGTHARGEGVNFAFFSRHASRVRLELFDHPDDVAAYPKTTAKRRQELQSFRKLLAK
jgi:pullulanase/glycogen debranching enzyme